MVTLAELEALAKTHQLPYSIDESAEVFVVGDAPVEVRIPYGTTATEAALVGDLVPLVEAASDGATALVKVIAPGWGSSGYYSAEMLKRDGPSVFTEGMKMYVDHPTVSERRERPERSVRDIAGVLTSNAEWQENGSQGPGLYARARVLRPYQDVIKEAAGAGIGVSIRADGRVKAGEAEGRKGPVVEAITAARSVDFVTEPGAGGRVAQLFESARERWAPELEEKPMPEITEAEREALARIPDLTEALARLERANMEKDATIVRLRTAETLREAQAIAGSIIRPSSLPDVAKDALVQRVVTGSLPLTEAGELDSAAFTEGVRNVLKAEAEYLGKVLGSPIRFAGGDTTQVKETRPEERDALLRESGAALGLRGMELEAFVKGAN